MNKMQLNAMKFLSLTKYYLKYHFASEKLKAKAEFDEEMGKLPDSSLRKNIQFENLEKIYGNGQKAITDLSFEIKSGEFIVLLGPSGCGKTTLLRMIAGLENISAGYLKFNGTIMNAVQPKDREVAMVFQNYALYPFMNVYKNIAFGLNNKTKKNLLYNNGLHEYNLSVNPKYQEINLLKTKKKLLKKNDPLLLDLKVRYQRIIKIARKNKDSDSIKKYSKLFSDVNKKMEEMKSHYSKAKIVSLEEDIKKLKDYEGSLSSQKQIDEYYENQLEKFQRKIYFKKLWKDNIPNIVDHVTTMLGINMYTRRKPADLSGGQRQRVALSRAISKQTGLFLYDEPLSNLDAKLRARMRTEIRKLHNILGATSVYVTHDQIEAMSMADKIVVMKNGFIQQIGSPKKLLESPLNLFVAKFIGNTDVNIINVKHVKDSMFKKDGSTINIKKYGKNMNDILKGKDVVMGIRPEHIIVDRILVQNSKFNQFTGEVEFVELLGNDVLLTVKSKKLGKIQMISPLSQNVQIGEKIDFVLNINKIHIYDEQTGFNLLENFDEVNERARRVWLNGEEDRRKNIYLMNAERNHLTWSEFIRIHIQSIFSASARQKIKDRKQKIDYGNTKKAQ